MTSVLKPDVLIQEYCHAGELSNVERTIELILLAMAENGQSNLSLKTLCSFFPGLTHKPRREKLLNALNKFTLQSRTGEMLKVYEYVRIEDDMLVWAYTDAYTAFYPGILS